MAEILKGAPAAEALTGKLAERAVVLKRHGTEPCLALLRAGENESDLAYERGAMKRCAKAGIRCETFVFPPDVSQDSLLDTIRKINDNPLIHGCLMFRPLPKSLNEQAVCEALLPQKDVDGMTSGSLAAVFTGQGQGFAPCTAEACIELLDYYGAALNGAKVTVIGRSLVIGRPVAMLLLQRHATVTICHTRTKNPAGICRGADILIVAAGKAGLIDRTYTNPDQIVVDVGINVDEEGHIRGDVLFEETAPAVRAITPVPGGVGSLTTAVLCKHVIEAAEMAAGS